MNKPFWQPTEKIITSSNIYKMMQENNFFEYDNFWKWSVNHKEEFWKQTVNKLGIQLKKKYTSIVDVSKGVENAQWLKNAQINIVDSCFQNSEEAVVISFQEEGKQLQHITQAELLKLWKQIQ